MHRRLVPLFGMLIAGCSNVISLSPVVSESSAVMDDRLIGDWISDDSTGKGLRVTVSPGENRSYQLRLVEGPDSSTAMGRLMPIGQRLLLDLTPTRASQQAIDQHGGIPVHSLLLLELSDSLIRASTINGDTLRARVRRGVGPALQLARAPGGDIMLTDSTARLEAGLRQYLSSPGITHKGETFRRPVMQGSAIPRAAAHMSASYDAQESVRPSPPSSKVGKGMVYGAAIGAVAGAVIGATLADPNPRVMLSGRDAGALGGGLLGAIAGAIVGGITGALNQ